MKLLIIPLIAIISVNAHAVAWTDLCPDLSDLSRAIMQNRQKNMPMSQSMRIAQGGDNQKVNNFAVAEVKRAYKEPHYSTNEYQQNAINDFENDSYSMCLEALGSK